MIDIIINYYKRILEIMIDERVEFDKIVKQC